MASLQAGSHPALLYCMVIQGGARAHIMEQVEERISLVFSIRLRGERRFLLARVSFDMNDTEIVHDRRSRIPTFATEASARAFAARVFATHDAQTDDTEARQM